MLRRNLVQAILPALVDTPVIFLSGARQTGKSTLAAGLAQAGYHARYLTLDDSTTLAAAHLDPPGFIRALDPPTILDEVQRAPDLILAIKADVDRNRTPGRFFLTGSANILLLPRVADTLAGRVEVHTLWPVSQGEIFGVVENFLDAIFARSFHPRVEGSTSRPALFQSMLQGGYPEVLGRLENNRRRAWYSAYVTTILVREVRDIANIDGLTQLPAMIALLAARAGGLLNLADVSRSLAIPQTTVNRYLKLLQATFLVQLLQPWSTNLTSRLVKAPKVYLNDTGLLSYLLELSPQKLRNSMTLAGPLLENFVYLELLKQCGWSKTRVSLFHFRIQAGPEVDLVAENQAGDVVGIEIKAANSVTAQDFKGLKALKTIAGKKFKRGIVLYTGDEVIPFGGSLFAVPVPALWTRQ